MIKNRKGRIIKDTAGKLADGCQLRASSLLLFLDLEPKRFIFQLLQLFHTQVLLSLGLPFYFSSFLCPLCPHLSSGSFSLLPLVFWLLVSLAPLLTPGSSHGCSPSPTHPLLSLSFSPCHHLFSITLLSGWLMLETFQEFLIENTMRTVITSVSPGREAAAQGR